MKCCDIIRIIETIAPLEYAESWDNSGFLCGDRQADIKGLLISLDYTEKTLEEARTLGCDMVITHHPFIFSKLSSIDRDTPLGRLIIDTCKAGINVYSAHTSLDYADGGTGDALFEALGLCNKEGFMYGGACGRSLGRVGYTKTPVKYIDFVDYVREKLDLTNITYVGDDAATVFRVALIAGSGAGREYLLKAKGIGADAYVTGDLKYHDAAEALALGLNVVDATHFASEVIICRKLKRMILELGGGAVSCGFIHISRSQSQPFKVKYR